MPYFLLKRILPFAILVCLLSGCWERKEVNDIGIVTATGIDLMENGSIRVSLLLAIPRLVGTSSSASGGGETQLETTAGWIVSEEGETVMDAYRNIQGKLPRQIFFSHNRIIIIGEKLAQNGVMPVLDFFERARQSQLNSFVLVTKTEAEEMLKFKPKFEKLASEVIKEELKTGIGPSVRIGRFLAMVMDSGDEPYAPQIAIVSSEQGASHSKDTKNVMATRGTAAFRGDRLVGWLNDRETRGLMWIRNEMKEGVITVSIPPDLGGGRISAEFAGVHSKLTPVVSKEKIQMHIDVSASLKVYENVSKLDLSEPANTSLLRTLIAEDIRRRIESVCLKAQKTLRTDILGFGQAIYRQQHKAWNKQYAKEWTRLFPEVQVVIKPVVQVINTGLIQKDTKWEDMK